MKLVGALKEKIYKCSTKEEVLAALREAGVEFAADELKLIELDDEDLDDVSGGASAFPARHVFL